MNDHIERSASPPAFLARLPFYYGWVQMLVAAAAMVGTLPGRTQGLGLITEPLLKDMGFTRTEYAEKNLWATLIGALFAIGVGRVIDRFGSRVVLTSLSVLLGLVVIGMALNRNEAAFVALLTLTRGFGQSALSVASLALVGRWFVRRLNLAMAWYSIALSVGFMIAFPLIGYFVAQNGWRVAWGGIGAALLFGLAPQVWLWARRSPESLGVEMDGAPEPSPEAQRGSNLPRALSTPAFWVIGLTSALFGLIASGIGLFNEAILAERGFSAKDYQTTLAVTALTSLAGNFLGGWLTSNRPLERQHRLMGVAMALCTLCLLALTQIYAFWQALALATVFGVASGFVFVIFFAYWAQAFGHAHLGKIQGVAQALTVFASAVGPLILAQCVTATGSYAGAFYVLALLVGLAGVCAWFVPAPPSPGADAAPG